VEGYPPLPEPLRAEIRAVEWQFPADLRLSELESRVADRLRSEFDVQEVSVTLDERGRATVAAAPPAAGVSKRTQSGKRAVSVETLVPTGVARGDEVAVLLDGDPVEGTVVSARSQTGTAPKPAAEPAGEEEPVDGEQSQSAPAQAPTTTGGEGRVTVAVSRTDADRVLATDAAPVVVKSRGTRREYELLGVLRRAGQRVRRVTVGDASALATGTTPAEVRDEHGVAVLAVRGGDGWRVAPDAGSALAAGDEVFVAGSRADLDRFTEVAA
jgi:hypothetical protein